LGRAAEAEALPAVAELKQLEKLGFRLRRGQLTMVAGQPGTMKSTFAQWWAQRMNVRTLYFSADNDAFITITRLLASMTGLTSDEVESALADEDMKEHFAGVLKSSKIQFCFDSAPTLDDIADEVACFVELWDEYPDLIVVDNLMNVEAEMGEEYAGLRMVAKEMHRLGRETKAAVLVLHHMREEGDPGVVPERRQLAGKISQLPERILGVAFDGTRTFRMGILKNRSGKQDPSGKECYLLSVDPERATFTTYIPQSLYYGGAS
jgi:predicted ATP-dependent serine protease